MKTYRIIGTGYYYNSQCLTWATESNLEEIVQRLRSQGYDNLEIEEEKNEPQDFEPAKVSLCRNCQCMTHTLVGNVCGKCLKPKNIVEDAKVGNKEDE